MDAPCTVERRRNTTAAHERVETTPLDSNQCNETALVTSDAHQDRPVRGEPPTVVAIPDRRGDDPLASGPRPTARQFGIS
jgi:hypothetical protein